MSQRVRFVITGNARTGSTMLVDALKSHPNIVAFGEVYNPLRDYVPFGFKGHPNDDPEAFAFRARDPVGFLHQRVYGGHPEHYRAVGFKYLYQHFGWFEGITEELVRDTEIRVVHLTRRNLLRNHVSEQIALATDQWAHHRWETVRENLTPLKLVKSFVQPGRAVSRVRQIFAQQKHHKELNAAFVRPKVTISVENCLNAFKWTRNQDAACAQTYAEHPYLRIEYEEFLEDRDAVFERVQRFLGVEPRTLTVRLERQNPEPLSELIDNYDEIAAALRGTEYESFLEEESRGDPART